MLSLCTAVAFALIPLSYSRFSWEAFGQPYGDGEICSIPMDCISGFCTDGVCCDTLCDQPGRICNAPNREGICTSVSSAPALSTGAQLLAVVALIVGAAFGWFSRRSKA